MVLFIEVENMIELGLQKKSQEFSPWTFKLQTSDRCQVNIFVNEHGKQG